MAALTFCKWSPCGNTTLLFPAHGLDAARQARLAAAALDASCLGGEQAGFVDMRARSLRMAGGEFCVNAARAFGAQLALEAGGARQSLVDGAGDAQDFSCDVRVSGWPSPVGVHARGFGPQWQVAARLALPPCPVVRPAPGVTLVRLPGIVHLLMDGATHLLPENCLAAAAMLRRDYELDKEAACGVIWWRRRQQQLEMLPVVHVRDAGTDFLEGACGSGALALALSLHEKGRRRRLSLLQPSGGLLDVEIMQEGDALAAEVDGDVHLVAQGRVWLPDADELPGMTAPRSDA